MSEHIKNINKPWIRGIVENIYASDLIKETTFENKNRIRLILLDTSLEIAFKNYLIYEKKIPVDKDKKLERKELIKRAKNNTLFQEEIWTKLDYFYGIRCELYHEHAGKTLMESDINDFHKIVAFIVTTLFSTPYSLLEVDALSFVRPQKNKIYVPINELKPLDQIILSVGRNKLKTSSEVHNAMKEAGARNPLKATNITAYIKSPSYNHFFIIKDDEIKLTESGEARFSEIVSKYEPEVKK